MGEKKTLIEKLNYIQTKLVAPKGQKNDFGHYKYRSCEDILLAVKPLLVETGCTITISDEIVCIPASRETVVVETKDAKGIPIKEVHNTDRWYVKARATLSFGTEKFFVNGYARESMNKKGMDDAQITGATSSYARKYALNGLLAIDDTKDADATNRHGKEETKKPATKEPEKIEPVKTAKDIAKADVLAIVSLNFKTKEDFDKWCEKKVIKTKIKDMTEGELSQMLDLLVSEFEEKK